MPDVTVTKLKKTDYIPFLNVSATDTASWKRISRSTIFSLAANAQTKTVDYISYELPIDELESYKPELPQEIALYEGDPVYDFIFGKFYDLPTGTSASGSMLMCFGGTGMKAWSCDVTLVMGELNTVDGKITFTIKINTITRGTYVIASGVPTFTATPST